MRLSKPRPTLALLLLVSLASGFLVNPALGQEEGTRPEHIRITKIEIIERGPRPTMQIVGETFGLPEGTEFDAHLIWRSQVVDRFEIISGAGGRIDTVHQVAELPVSHDSFRISTQIPEDPPKKVKDAIEKDSAKFPENQEPWTTHHPQLFRLFDDDQVSALAKPIRDAVLETFDRIIAIDKEIHEQADLATYGDAFTKKTGELDEEKWTEMLGERLAELEAKIDEAKTAIKEDALFRPYRRSGVLVQNAAALVALRAVDRSRVMYASLGLTWADDEERTKPFAELATLRRARAGERVLSEIRQEIRHDLGLIPSDFVEFAYAIVDGDDYLGAIFRHLTDAERERGEFDAWRTIASWTPTEEDVAAFEASLETHLETALPESNYEDTIRFFRRQYVGIERGDSKRIYCVFLSPSSRFIGEWLQRVIDPEKDPTRIVTIEWRVGTTDYDRLRTPESNKDPVPNDEE